MRRQMLAAYALGCLLMVFRACAYTPALVQTRVRRCMGHAMKGATPHVQRRHTLRMIDVSDPEDPSTRYFYSQKEFADIGASADMLAALPTLKLHKPSKIQAIAYRPLLAGDHCIVADQTGSGKTLAYLLPLIQRLKQQIKGHTISPAKPRQAYVLILAPTSELTLQIVKVARNLAQAVSFRTACITGTGMSPIGFHDETERLRRGVEVLVATPGKLSKLIESNQIDLSMLQSIVLDETDVLFMDDSFALQPLGANAPPTAQFVFVTATLPDVVVQQIAQEFPTVKKLTGPGLHKVAPTIDETLIDCSGPPSELKNKETGFERKKDMLIKILGSTKLPRTLIFCNTIQICRKVENALNRADKKSSKYKVLAFHAALENHVRDRNLAEFSRPLQYKPIVLVCTDRASRGSDFDRTPIDHVILFDFPRDPSEYVRRIGRTGRAGRRGMATILAQGRQMPVARQVMQASRNGAAIEPIPEMNRFDDE